MGIPLPVTKSLTMSATSGPDASRKQLAVTSGDSRSRPVLRRPVIRRATSRTRPAAAMAA
jgi:hypothetical protein